ncbi:MAG: hypothetical protein AAF593_16715, partial [Planctomycetota bacterium]
MLIQRLLTCLALIVLLGTAPALHAEPFGPISGADSHAIEQTADDRWVLTLSRNDTGEASVALPAGADAIVLPAAAGV